MQPETDIPVELSEKILAFVEREAGRDAPLSPDDETMVRELLATDPAAKALADDFRDVDTDLKAAFQALGDIPVSDELMERIHAQDQAFAAKANEATTDKVVAFPPATTPATRSYVPLAAAASLALVIAGGSFLYQFETRKDLEQTLAEVEAERSKQQSRIDDLEAESGSLQDQLVAATDAREDAETALSTVSDDLGRLEAELATVIAARSEADDALASTTETLTSVRETETELKQQILALEEEAGQVAVDGATERNALQSQLADVETDLARVAEARRTAEIEMVEANRTIGELIEEGAALNQKVAKLETETEILAANIAARELQLEESRTALAQAEQRAAELATERETLAAAVGRDDQELEEARSALARLDDEATELRRERDALAVVVDQGRGELAIARAQLASAQQQSAAFQTALETLRAQTGWLAQVAGYHIGYAGKPREVEVKANQWNSQTLANWLSSELGQEITIPRDLPMQGGLTLVGGRVLYTVDGQPIGQIAYHDSEGRLTAFCIKRNPTGAADGELKQAQFFGRLQMIHWQDEAFQYALVGFADFETLEPVASWLEGNYGEDT